MLKNKDVSVPAVIGLPSLIKLNLVQRIDLVTANEKLRLKDLLNDYKSVFEGMGCIKNFEYDIKIKDNAEPTVAACRKVPLILSEQVKNELIKMQNEGIIEKVTEPTDWVHPMVITRKKNGSIRICIDPTQLNKYIRRQYYKIPNFEDVSSTLAECKVFSTLDADRAFHQIRLSEKSSNYLVMITPFGRFRFLRMPFGISSATEVFQECFENIFADIEGVDIYIDDIRIKGKNESEHNARLKKVVERAQEYNITFKKEKCNFLCNKIKYMGHYFSDKGISIDSKK